MNKIVRIGSAMTYFGRSARSVFCTINIVNGRLSITGVEGPLSNGDCVGGCGQIQGSIPKYIDDITFAPGWNKELLTKFLSVWKRWHLNDMRAGSQVQEDWLRANPISFQYPQTHYDTASAALTAAGLNPDADGYKYGHAWKYEQLPDDVVQFLQALPESDTKLTRLWLNE